MNQFIEGFHGTLHAAAVIYDDELDAGIVEACVVDLIECQFQTLSHWSAKRGGESPSHR